MFVSAISLALVFLIWQADGSDGLVTILVAIKLPHEYRTIFEVDVNKAWTGQQLRAKVEEEMFSRFQPMHLAIDYVMASSDIDFEGRLSRLCGASQGRPLNLKIAVHPTGVQINNV